jgi:hypothetical protein
MAPLFFDAGFEPILTNKTPGEGRDMLEASSNNLYAGVTMRALETFEERYALNSRLVAQNGHLVETCIAWADATTVRSAASSDISPTRCRTRRRAWRRR